ncbi:MAG: hypothetical protein Q4D13_06025 [Erysipelotrichaceae bacterium]|nr:hypothetical protein [Erysipelotrichaceae bacterium]
MNRIKHNTLQYLGKECPHCGGKVKKVKIDEEIEKQCENCNKVLKENNSILLGPHFRTGLTVTIGSLVVFLSTYDSKIGYDFTEFYISLLFVAVGFVFDFLLYIVGDRKRYK